MGCHLIDWKLPAHPPDILTIQGKFASGVSLPPIILSISFATPGFWGKFASNSNSFDSEFVGKFSPNSNSVESGSMKSLLS